MQKLRGLEISTAIGCKLNCRYCPQSLLVSRYYQENNKRVNLLSFEGFKKAIENVDEDGFISFCGMVEPFHNPKCADMIRYAYEKGHRIYLFTTLMGMTEEDFEKIKDVKFDFFELHIPDKQENSHFVIDDTYKKLLVKMQEKFHTYTYSCHGDVHPEVESLIDSSKYAGLMLADRAGNLDIGKEKIYSKSPFLCVHGFEDSLNQWIPVMCPDGTLVACCNDYGMKHQFGNLIENTWEEISHMEEYVSFRQSWNDEKIDSLCRHCGSAMEEKFLPSVKLKNLLGNKAKREHFNNLTVQQKETYDRLSQAKEILIWGIGSYYKDHYKYLKWDKVLQPKVVLDSNPSKWNNLIDGVVCKDPYNYNFIDGSLVILFVKNTESMEKFLEDKGVKYIKIDDIFGLANAL